MTKKEILEKIEEIDTIFIKNLKYAHKILDEKSKK